MAYHINSDERLTEGIYIRRLSVYFSRMSEINKS